MTPLLCVSAALVLTAALLVLNRRLHRWREAEARNRRNLAIWVRSCTLIRDLFEIPGIGGRPRQWDPRGVSSREAWRQLIGGVK